MKKCKKGIKVVVSVENRLVTQDEFIKDLCGYISLLASWEISELLKKEDLSIEEKERFTYLKTVQMQCNKIIN